MDELQPQPPPCTPVAPRCTACPLADRCRARETGRTQELPRVPARARDADKPELAASAAWVERAGRILLARRAPEGLFGGLWELPQAEDRAALEQLLRELGATFPVADGTGDLERLLPVDWVPRIIAAGEGTMPEDVSQTIAEPVSEIGNDFMRGVTVRAAVTAIFNQG